jgi:hypothetical protein
MHFNFHFTAVQTLWTLTFAAQAVLLVVLLGRDRAKRFPWFTLSIVMMALRLLASRLLYGRMAPITLSTILVTIADVAAIAGFLVVVEMARRAFAPVRRAVWLQGALAVLLVGVLALAAWGPWPAWKTLTADSPMAALRLMQLGAQKLDMLVDLLTVELGLLVVLLGRRTGAGWHTHVQRLVIGLSTASSSQLAVEGIWQYIARTAAPHTQAELDHLLRLRDNLFNANGVVYIAVLIWWIACLWKDEPGAADGEPPLMTPQPEYLEAVSEETVSEETASEQPAQVEPGADGEGAE